MNKSAWTILVIVVVAALLGWYWFENKHQKIDDLVLEENAVLIQDQPSGDETVVTYAKLSKPGYVLVYSPDASGRTLLGSSDLLPAGEHKRVLIVHRGGGSRVGNSLSAEVVADNGDGVYTEGDTEVLVEEGDAGTEAEVSDEAVLDTDLTDEELEGLLEEAGYTTEEEEAGTEEEAVEDTTPQEETAPEGETVEEGTTEAEVEAEAENPLY